MSVNADGSLNVTVVGGGGGGNVSIISPVDANGYVEVDLKTPIPAGTNAIGSVSVSNFPATQPVSGTVTANAGTGTFNTKDAADGTVGSAVPSTAIYVGAKNPSGNTAGLQLDANSQLKTSSLGLTLNATGQVSVGTSATVISAANTDQAGVLITNASATATVYLGASGVTSSTGAVLAAGSSITIPTISAVYGIVSTGTATVSYISLTE
jgi:hypothetical protein